MFVMVQIKGGSKIMQAKIFLDFGGGRKERRERIS